MGRAPGHEGLLVHILCGAGHEDPKELRYQGPCVEVPQAWDLGSPRFGHGVLKGLEQVPKDGEWGSPSGYPVGVPKVMRCGSLGPCLKVLRS